MRALIIVLTVLLIGSPVAVAQDIRGVWRLVEITVSAGPDSGRHTTDVQPGLVIYTEKHYSGMSIEAFAPRPLLSPSASEEERQRAWRPFVGNAGTYVYRDSTLQATPIVAKSPNAMGVTRTLEAHVVADTLWTVIRERNGVERRLKLIRVEHYPSR